ncbi:MAG: hypothetical protein ACLU38_03245 [Dysosmobacter sp.]
MENLAGEIEAIDGRIQENEVRSAAAGADRGGPGGEAASCATEAESHPIRAERAAGPVRATV